MNVSEIPRVLLAAPGRPVRPQALRAAPGRPLALQAAFTRLWSLRAAFGHYDRDFFSIFLYITSSVAFFAGIDRSKRNVKVTIEKDFSCSFQRIQSRLCSSFRSKVNEGTIGLILSEEIVSLFLPYKFSQLAPSVHDEMPPAAPNHPRPPPAALGHYKLPPIITSRHQPPPDIINHLRPPPSIVSRIRALHGNLRTF